MRTLRRYLSGLASKGVLSPGWDAILTGGVMVYLAYLLGMGESHDAAAPYVAVGFGVVGLWLTGRGVWLELRRRRPG